MMMVMLNCKLFRLYTKVALIFAWLHLANSITKNFVNNSIVDIRPTFVVNFDISTVICQHSNDTDDLHLHEISILCDGKVDCYKNYAIDDEAFPYCEGYCNLTCSNRGACLFDGTKGQCYCNSGYHGPNCEYEDDNECQDKPCHWFANCQNTFGSHYCTCFPGFKGTGYECADINECENGEAKCPEYSTCVNVPGTHFCNCSDGFRPLGLPVERCADIDECVKGYYNCSDGLICQNTVGGYRCVEKCSEGHAYINNTCVDINECENKTGSCDKRATCINTIGSYKCECEEGFSGDGHCCSPTNDCSQHEGICDRHAFCVSTLKLCICEPGYAGDGLTCYDVNECDGERNPCATNPDTRCVNIDGGFMCCGKDADDENCMKENGAYCAGGCGVNAACRNTSCQCFDGYDGDPRIKCDDINECENDKQCLGADEWCVNTIGSYVCCEKRSNVSECRSKLQNASSKHRKPISGSSTRTISHDGAPNVTCTASCPRDSHCENDVCICNAGFERSHFGECIDINECHSNPCTKSQPWCVNLHGSYRCCTKNSSHFDCFSDEIQESIINENQIKNSNKINRSVQFGKEVLFGQISNRTEKLSEFRGWQNFSAGSIIIARGSSNKKELEWWLGNNKDLKSQNSFANMPESLRHGADSMEKNISSGSSMSSTKPSTTPPLLDTSKTGVPLTESDSETEITPSSTSKWMQIGEASISDSFRHHNLASTITLNGINSQELTTEQVGADTESTSNLQPAATDLSAVETITSTVRNLNGITQSKVTESKTLIYSELAEEYMEVSGNIQDTIDFGSAETSINELSDPVVSEIASATSIFNQPLEFQAVELKETIVSTDATLASVNRKVFVVDFEDNDDFSGMKPASSLVDDTGMASEDLFNESSSKSVIIEEVSKSKHFGDRSFHPSTSAQSLIVKFNNTLTEGDEYQVSSFTFRSPMEEEITKLSPTKLTAARSFLIPEGDEYDDSFVAEEVGNTSTTNSREDEYATKLMPSTKMRHSNSTLKAELETEVVSHEKTVWPNVAANYIENNMIKSNPSNDEKSEDNFLIRKHEAIYSTRSMPTAETEFYTKFPIDVEMLDTTAKSTSTRRIGLEILYVISSTAKLNDTSKLPYSSTPPMVGVSTESLKNSIQSIPESNEKFSTAEDGIILTSDLDDSMLSRLTYTDTNSLKIIMNTTESASTISSASLQSEADSASTAISIGVPFSVSPSINIKLSSTGTNLLNSASRISTESSKSAKMVETETIASIANISNASTNAYAIKHSSSEELIESDNKAASNGVAEIDVPTIDPADAIQSFTSVEMTEFSTQNERNGARNDLINLSFVPEQPKANHCYSRDDCSSDTYCERMSGACRCSPGFARKPPITLCKDIDECSLRFDECHETSHCLNTNGGYICLCETGFRRDSNGVCIDIDECEERKGRICGNNAVCLNLQGSYACKCEPGYTGDGYTCIPLEKIHCKMDEQRNECDRNQICLVDIHGKSDCGTCKSGFIQKNNSCSDIDECEDKGMCHGDAFCKNLIGSFECQCQPGYSGDGFQCTDINECFRNPCHPQATCINIDGSFSCQCPVGWKGDGLHDCFNPSDESCMDKTTICNSTDHSACLSIRTNTVHSVCECQTNFRYNSMSSHCEDIDECAENRHDCNPSTSVCVNTVGGYMCECSSGYEGTGGTCVDIDECERGLAGCNVFAHCENHIGSFGCKCSNGFSGDGLICIEQNKTESPNECNQNWQSSCQSQNRSCHIDKEDVPQCGSCLFGYQPINGSCRLIHTHGACADLSQNDCDPNADCIDVYPGRHFCACNFGFIGDGRLCDDVDECSMRDLCDSNAQCQNTVGGFSCACNKGYTGNGFKCLLDENIAEAAHGGKRMTMPPGIENDPRSRMLTESSAQTIQIIAATEMADTESHNIVQKCLVDDLTPCHDLAECDNENGFCKCISGYYGDGYLTCVKKRQDCILDPTICNERAVCDVSLRKCKCLLGYAGHGTECIPDVADCVLRENICSLRATCIGRRCVCKDGYTGDGSVCILQKLHTNCSQCNRKAKCINGVCKCDEGYLGNGLICIDDPKDCENHPRICHPYAKCDQNRRECVCMDGFSGDGYECTQQEDCTKNSNICHYNAECLPFGVCQCKTGYIGNGINCKRISLVNKADGTMQYEKESTCYPVCKVNEECIRGSCLCKRGYTKNPYDLCTDVNECDLPGSCDSLAHCTNHDGSFECLCPNGYNGDGKTCVRYERAGPMSVDCELDGMLLLLENESIAYDGRIYVRGQTENPLCSKRLSSLEYRSGSYFFNVSYAHCNVRFEAPDTVAITIVLQRHPMFITQRADAYDLRCTYPLGSYKVTGHVNVLDITTTNTIIESGNGPKCQLVITDQDNNGIETATVGQYLKLTLSVSPNESYGILPRNCYAMNLENGEHYPLTDQAGCAIDTQLFADWFNSSPSVTTATFRIFKWPDSSMIRFQCDCSTCLESCPKISCNRRREAIKVRRLRKRGLWNNSFVDDDLYRALIRDPSEKAFSSALNVEEDGSLKEFEHDLHQWKYKDFSKQRSSSQMVDVSHVCVKKLWINFCILPLLLIAALLVMLTLRRKSYTSFCKSNHHRNPQF